MDNLDDASRDNKLYAPLRSVKFKNRILYLDGDPFLNYQVPLGNGLSVNELADEIQRACVTYDRSVTWEAARSLARQLLEYQGEISIGH